MYIKTLHKLYHAENMKNQYRNVPFLGTFWRNKQAKLDRELAGFSAHEMLDEAEEMLININLLYTIADPDNLDTYDHLCYEIDRVSWDKQGI